MFRNYLVVALRNAGRHRLYSFITIAGLTVALACAIFILLFIADELSYDQWIPDTQNLYRVQSDFYFPGRGRESVPMSPFPVAPAMAAHIPQVTAQTHLITEQMTAKVNGRLFNAFVDVVDPNFFSMIRLPFVEGDARSVFKTPDSVVLSQAMARKYFGAADPIGKTVLLNGKHPMTVTGIIRDLPHNTQLVADVVIPNTSRADTMSQRQKQAWLNIQGEAFVRLAPGANPARVIEMTAQVIDAHVDPRKEMGVNLRGSQVLSISLTPFTQVHLSSDTNEGMKPGGSWIQIYGLGAIAALILLIASFNFTNLATARAMMRAREVALRKVLGAHRHQLIAQFLGESALTAVIALSLSLGLVELLTPAYDGLIGRPVAFHYLANWPLLLAVIGIALTTGLLGGTYPAFVLSGFRPAVALRNNSAGHTGSGAVRTALVVLQFAISIGLGIAAVVVFVQVRYSSSVALGFNRHNVVVIENADALTPVAQKDLAHILASEPSIAGAALSGPVPFSYDTQLSSYQLPGAPQQIIMRAYNIAPGYAELYGLHLIAGRDLSHTHANDEDSGDHTHAYNVLVNVMAARKLGYTAKNAVGKTFRQDKHVLTIVGVYTNPRLDGPQAAIAPVVFYYDPPGISRISIRIKPGQTRAALAAIDRDWQRIAPNTAIARRFLSDSFAKLFHADAQRDRMFAIFVAIAIFIACLGLYGLAAFTSQRRTKEIGIRKVFGARATDVVRLLLWQFSIPVLLANVIAWPVAWYYLSGWLEGFAERIWLNPAYFAGAGLVALAIAWVTVITHALRAARAKPVQALRYE